MREYSFTDETLVRAEHHWPKSEVKSVLAIGVPDQWTKIADTAGVSASMTALQFNEFAQATERLQDFGIVMSQVIFGKHDCVDLAGELCRVGYEGRYVIITEGVANPRVLLTELLSTCPGLTIELVAP